MCGDDKHENVFFIGGPADGEMRQYHAPAPDMIEMKAAPQLPLLASPPAVPKPVWYSRSEVSDIAIYTPVGFGVRNALLATLDHYVSSRREKL